MKRVLLLDVNVSDLSTTDNVQTVSTCTDLHSIVVIATVISVSDVVISCAYVAVIRWYDWNRYRLCEIKRCNNTVQ